MPEHFHPGHALSPVYLPTLDRLPPGCHDAILRFREVQQRRADAVRAHNQAHTELPAAERADQDALDDHVRQGGTAADYTPTAVPAVQQRIANAKADTDSLERFQREVYLDMCRAITAQAGPGAEIARREIHPTQTAYLAAITELQDARRRYLAAIGLSQFWTRYVPNHQLVYSERDFVYDRRNSPATRVDDEVIKQLRADADTHLRLDPPDLTEPAPW